LVNVIDNTEEVYMHTRLTVQGVLKKFINRAHSSLTLFSWMKSYKKPPHKGQNILYY